MFGAGTNESSSKSYYTQNAPPSTIGVIRSRTLFFLSIRDSIAPSTHASGANVPLLGDSQDGVYFDADKNAIPMPSTLPPFWVDATEEVDAVSVSYTHLTLPTILLV